MFRIEAENVDTSTGVNLFKTTPPYTVITPEWVNSVQEEIMYVVEQAGLPILGEANDTRTQLWTAIRNIAQSYDYIVDSQATFVALFTRTGANAYDIYGDYKSVYFKNISGGYEFSNVLSDGDTWGDIYTNNCEHLEFENGTYIDFANAVGNITVETTGCLLKNVDIRGAGSVASAITESFKLNANYVTFENCKTSQRLSNTTFNGFEGSGTAAHNQTSKYVNCSAYTLDSSGDVSGFNACFNIVNGLAYDIDSSVANDAYGFNTCSYLSSCYATDIDSVGGTAYGFDSCTYKDISCYSDEASTQLDIGANFYSLGQSGFGTTSVKGAAGVVHIANGTNADTNWNSAAPLIIERNDDAVLNIRTPNNKIGAIIFSDPDAVLSGYIRYDHSADDLTFYTGASGRARFNATGLYIGGAANPSNLLHIQGTTTPQFRIAYDADSYWTVSVANGGGITWAAGEATGDFNIYPGASNPYLDLYSAGATTVLRIIDSTGTRILALSQNSTNGIISNGYGNLLLSSGTAGTNNITISNTTDSSSKDTGALIVEGGVGIEKNLSVGETITTYGANGLTAWDGGGTEYIRVIHDGTDGNISTTGGGGGGNIKFANCGIEIAATYKLGIGLPAGAYQLNLQTDSAGKPSTNTWTIVSDKRLKKDFRDFKEGLSTILSLNPVWYKYNGKGGFKDDGKENIGFIAQDEIEKIPYMFNTYMAKLNKEDEDDTELLNYNGHALPFLLINAIKELSEKIDKLEEIYK